MNITGKEFEKLIVFRAGVDEERGKYSLGRYGVQGVFFKSPGSTEAHWQPIQSYPDFEGVLFGGRQFIFEAKVCSGASFDLANVTKFAERQYRHMSRRAVLGSICFILLHFNARQLKTKSNPAETFAIPVHPHMPLWRSFVAHEVKTLTREDASMHGVLIPWNTHTERAQKETPDLFQAISAVLNRLPALWQHPTLEDP